MNSIPIQKPLWFDDAATSAMGEAFDNACRSLGNFESAVPEIIANRIIAAAQVGERDFQRQKALNPERCQRRIVSGFTTCDKSSRLGQIRVSHINNARSLPCNRRRGGARLKAMLS